MALRSEEISIAPTYEGVPESQEKLRCPWLFSLLGVFKTERHIIVKHNFSSSF